MADDHVPGWVPELSPGIHADVYPVSPPRSPTPTATPAELRLDRHSVTHGYAERRLPYEFSSILPSDRPAPPLTSAQPGEQPQPNPLTNADLHKLRLGLATLRRTRPTKLQRVEIHSPPLSGKPFPLQKPSAPSSLEDWFKRLSTSTPLSELSKSVPLGPAIVRAAGKVIEMLATRNVPTQRAAWYIRIAVLNEVTKQIRPDRPLPSPHTFWTRQLCTLLKADVEAIRARKTAVLGSMDRVAFWKYVLHLARWQADEGLLEIQPWLNCICAILRSELSSNQTLTAPASRISLLAARRFLPEFLASVEFATQLCDALMSGATAVVKAWRAAVTKPAKGRKPPKRFSTNACHAEITLLLAAALRAIHSDVTINSEMRLPDLERLVKRADDVVRLADRRRKVELPEVPHSPHIALRELERLAIHGDVARVVAALRAHSNLRVAVRRVCEWAVEGPVSDRSEALCIGTTVLAALSEQVRTSSGPRKRMRKGVHQARGASMEAPPLHRDIWTFIKEYSEGRDAESVQREDHLVRFVAVLCRLDQLSLPLFARDISRLASCTHAGAPYLVKCLSLLPDPVDKSIADCRRALLRKYRYASIAKSDQSRGIDEKALQAACSGDISAARSEAEAMLKAKRTNAILSTAEAVRLEDVSFLQKDETPIESRLYTKASFLLHIGEPNMAVEWILDTLGDLMDGTGPWSDVQRSAQRQDVLMGSIRVAEQLAKCIASSGDLESVFNLLYKAWTCKWISPSIRAQILRSQAAYCRLFGANSGNGSTYWTKMAVKNLRQASNPATESSLAPFAHASMRGREEAPPREVALNDILHVVAKENLGLNADDDLADLKSRRERCGIETSTLQKEFVEKGDQFLMDSYFLKGMSANDIFGSLLIPLMGKALKEPAEENPLHGLFSKFSVASLQLIGKRQHDVSLHGIRPGILLEFIAILIAGCLRGLTETSASLEVLVEMRWVWKVLSPGAGIGMAKRLRKRVDFHFDSATQNDNEQLSALLFNMVTRYSGEEGRDEGMVSNALGAEPFGIIEMQLALLATHRRESGEEHEFGTRISEAAISLICADSARTLVSTALRSCYSEESKHVVAGIVGFRAAETMSESLEYVVAGLTVEAAEDDELQRERAQQWCLVDSARRAVLECAVLSVSQEVGAQVETVLFDQLMSATEQLNSAKSKGSMLSDILEDGKLVSDALESRLNCILRIPRTPQIAGVWRQRILQVSNLLKSAVPLMKRSAIMAVSSVLHLCIRSLGEAGKPEDSPSPIPLTQILDRPSNSKLKKKFEGHMKSIALWMEPREQKEFAKNVPGCLPCDAGRRMRVKAYKADGAEVDNWALLEGYGRGTEEEPALPPSAFWRQGEGAIHGEEMGAAVHLKRTYSTFASLAV